MLAPSRSVRAEPAEPAARAPQPPGGHLLLRAGDAEPQLAPLLEIDATLRVTGMIARGTVAQRFRNPSDAWVEAVYVFPLPENAAVDGLRMRIGERRIEGEIREREQARRLYEAARESGRRASLLEQQRPNAFTSRLANVAPGAEIEVEIDVQWTLALDASGFALRLPWIVAPRFEPDGDEQDPTGGSDAGAVPTAPRGAPGATGPDVALAIDLDPGFPLAMLESPTHELDFEQLDLHRWLVTLRDAVAPADRDFVLRWRPTPGAVPRAALFSERRDDEEYLLLMLLPPEPEELAATPSSAREVIFVIDTSGSMGGPSIEQARAALRLALRRLGPGDRFNLVAFDSQTRVLFPAPVFADPPARDRALAFVDRLEAGGGTMMMPALVEALRNDAGGPDLRQVVFVTDGCVGNERELFAYVREHLGRSRLFTVGIGSAPNGFFMEGAARFGRGSRIAIASPQEVGEKMEALFEKLERPALTDVTISWNDDVETWPARVPDLYRGEPILVTARLSRFVGDVVVRGRLGEEPFEMRLPLVPGRAQLGIEKLFGRRKIASLLDGLVTGEDADRVRERVVSVALEHGLVSRYTSLVAVERTPVRPLGEALHAASVNAGLPAGFRLPQGGTAGPGLLLLSLVSGAIGALLRRLGRAERRA
jgi:Ca-activated chloride channel family protein